MQDGMEGVRRGEGEVPVESGEGYVALVLQWGEAEFHLEKSDGRWRDPEYARKGGVECHLKEVKVVRCVKRKKVQEGVDGHHGPKDSIGSCPSGCAGWE
jgi:hypothetical protein